MLIACKCVYRQILIFYIENNRCPELPHLRFATVQNCPYLIFLSIYSTKQEEGRVGLGRKDKKIVSQKKY